MVPVTHFPAPRSHTYETPSVRVTLRPDGIMHGVLKPLAMKEEHVRDNLDLRVSILEGRVVPIVLDVRGVVELTREARRAYASPESTATCCALAIITSPGLNRVVGNLLAAAVAMSGNAFPIRIFDTEDEAFAWAAQHLAARA